MHFLSGTRDTRLGRTRDPRISEVRCVDRRCFLLTLIYATATYPSAFATKSAGVANLVLVLDALNLQFQRTAPDVALTITTGASGSLYAQLKNGAPFDVFLSADTEYPRQAVANGLGEARSLRTFATGRLVFWSTNSRIDVANIAGTVRSPAIRKIALAQPKTAPYGRAAVAVLEHVDAWKT